MEHNEYEAQAERFLKRFNLTIKAAFKGDRSPPWEDRYRVTIKRGNKKSISFDFWKGHDGKALTAYDILASISREATSPTDPDEVAAEFGDMKPSQAIRIAKFAKRLQSFFTEQELEALTEIQ
jgi:hypothetical protein